MFILSFDIMYSSSKGIDRIKDRKGKRSIVRVSEHLEKQKYQLEN